MDVKGMGARLSAWTARCRKNKTQICTQGQFYCLAVGVAMYVLGLILAQWNNALYNISLVGEFSVFLCCVFFCFADLKNRFLLLSFDLVTFVFLMCRPLLNLLMGRMWYRHFAPDAVIFAVTCVPVSMMAMGFGTWLHEKQFLSKWLGKKKKAPVLTELSMVPFRQNLKDFRLVAGAFYLFTMAFFLLGELDKLSYMAGRDYNEFYSGYVPDYPFFVGTFAAMMPYVLCAYLASLPSKPLSFCALALYVLSAAPQFLIGIRNPIVLNALTALMYYLLRDYLGDRKLWMGKFEKRMLLIALPLAAFGLSALNYLRSGKGGEMAELGFFGAIVDLFYKQGVSFNVLALGFSAIPNLIGGNKCFTLGPFIDYLTQNRIGRVLFDSPALGSGNTITRAVYGNNFSHSMSLISHEDYLAGNGWGSSYILELFADFGWVGLVLGSVLLGWLLAVMVSGFRRGWFGRTVILIGLTDLFFVPRAEATGWLLFLAQPHFWLAMAACVVGTWICTKIRFRHWIPALRNKWKRQTGA